MVLVLSVLTCQVHIQTVRTATVLGLLRVMVLAQRHVLAMRPVRALVILHVHIIQVIIPLAHNIMVVLVLRRRVLAL